MQKFNGSLIRQFPSKITGNAAGGVQVTVKIAGSNTLATLYAANNAAGAQLSNPLTTDSKGFYSFYAADGKYVLEFNNGFPSLDIQLLDSVQWVSDTESGSGLLGQAASEAVQLINEANTELQAALDGLINTGWFPAPGSFDAGGGPITERNQYLTLITAVGEQAAGGWSWGGALPKTVTAGSTPETSGGIGPDAWVYRSDTTLRAALANGSADVGGVEAAVIANGLEFKTVSDMIAASSLPVGTLVTTYSHIVPIVTKWEIVSSDPSPHYAVAVSGGLFAKLVVEPEMSTLQVGADGSDNENIGLTVSRLYLSGCRRIILTNSTVQTSTLSIPDSVVIGNNCRVTSGKITDAKLIGVYHSYAGLTEETAPCKQLSGGVSHKLVFRSADGAEGQLRLGVVTKSADGNGFLFHEYRSNEGDGSSVSAGAPWGLLRSVGVLPVYNCVLLKKTFSAQSAAHPLISNIESSLNPADLSTYQLNSDGTTASNFIRAANIPPAGWQEYTITTAANNKSARKSNIAIYSSAVVSDLFTVTVGGVEVFSGPATRKGTQNSLWTIDFELSNSAAASSSVHTVRVTNNATNGNPLYVVGVNLYRLDEVPNPNTEFDSWKFWRDDVNPFINITGASDYAIFDSDLDQFVGSFHGGETSIELKFNVDGVQLDSTTFAASTFKVGECIAIQQRTDIVSKLTTYVTTTHHVDGVQAFRASMQGSMNCQTFYTMLTPTYREFDYIVHPVYLQNGIAGTLQNIGRATDVVQKRISTGQYVRTAYTQFDVSNNSRGGVYLDNKEGGTPGSISNRKVYYGPIYDNSATVERIGFEVQREFGKGKY